MKSDTQTFARSLLAEGAVEEDETLIASLPWNSLFRIAAQPAANEPVDPDSTSDDGIPIFLGSDPYVPALTRPSAVYAIDTPRSPIDVTDPTWDGPPRRSALESIGSIVGGRYRLGAVLGVGGMGTVFQATHTELGKRVAIKVLAETFDQDDEAKARFRREAMTVSTLESEHIAQVFDVGEDLALGLYMVMEYLPGEDLAHFLAQHGAMSPAAAASVVWQVCLALEHAHAAGVVHRDLKPANVFLVRTDEGPVKAKVLDFGIAKSVCGMRSNGVGAQTDIIVGTPRYMSPEQAQGLPTVDHLTDVYSLGSLLFEAIAGSSPYPRLATSEATLDVILREDPPRLGSKVQGLAPALDDLVAELMARDPAGRPQSARDVRYRLAAICSELGQQPLAPSGPPPPVPMLELPRAPAPTRAPIFVTVAAFAGGAILLGLLVALLAR